MYKGSNVIILAAYAKNRLIANEDGIPWKNDPECRELVKKDIDDLRKKIFDSSVILGRKTYEEICEIPNDPIANIWRARVVVMSRNRNYQIKKKHDFNVRRATNLEEALSKTAMQPIYILGGGEIYKEALNVEGLVDRIDITKINKSYEEKYQENNDEENGGNNLLVRFPTLGLKNWIRIRNETFFQRNVNLASFESYIKRENRHYC